ncbi:hypothetical protein [Flavobacterium magnesitis]|uniref:hypothetical protein n=1 Tax=Flavobacterium magnesitis TaxID=3138077 RepID=UPI00358E6598
MKYVYGLLIIFGVFLNIGKNEPSGLEENEISLISMINLAHADSEKACVKNAKYHHGSKYSTTTETCYKDNTPCGQSVDCNVSREGSTDCQSVSCL